VQYSEYTVLSMLFAECHVPVVKVVFYVKYVPTFTSLRLRARDSFFVFLLSFVWHSGMRPVPVVEVRFYGAETFAP
jgi:hypothetical protein